jgi:hypothetical protein
LSVTTHSITVNYSGDSNFTASTSGTLTQTVTLRASTTTLAASANPAVFDQTVTFTASVTGSGTPTGTVTFNDGSTTLATALLNAGGKATYSTSSLGVGTHKLTVVYGGDSNFYGSASASLAQTVSKDNTTVTIVWGANPAVYGQPITFTGTVTANAPGAGTPTGMVAFRDGPNTFGVGTLVNGQTTYTYAGLGVGTHSIQGSYSGDSNYNLSPFFGSPPQTINKASTTTVVASSLNPSNSGNAVTFTATITGNAPSTFNPANGTVTFLDGSTTLATAAVSSVGKATFTTTTLAVGTHPITATYGGNGSFTVSTSGTLVQTVNGTAQVLQTTTSPGGARKEAITAIVRFVPTAASVWRPTLLPTATGQPFADGAPGAAVTLAESLSDEGWPHVHQTSDMNFLFELMNVLDEFFAEKGI